MTVTARRYCTFIILAYNAIIFKSPQVFHADLFSLDDNKLQTQIK